MSHNSFGHIFKFTTWGESHGKAIGCVVDGTPPMIELTEKDIQLWLDKRRPGQNQYTSPRNEPDKVEILSCVLLRVSSRSPASTIALLLSFRRRPRRRNGYGQLEIEVSETTTR